jgi:teichuronic acid exporter
MDRSAADNSSFSSTPATNLQTRVLRSAGWIALEKWGVRLSSLVVFALLGRLLEPSDFGIVALATVALALVSVFVDSGFSQALIQRKNLGDEHTSTAFWISLGLAAFLTTALCAAAPLLGMALGEPAITPVLWAMSLVLPLDALSSVPAAVLQRDYGFRALALRRLVGVLAGSAVAVALALLNAGVWALVAQVLVGSAVSLVTLWLSSPWRPSRLFSSAAARDLWAVGSNVLGVELIALSNTQLDKLLVGAFVGPTALGYYFVGSRVVQILLDLVTSVIGSLSLTTFARMQDDLQRVVRAYGLFTFASALITFPIVALLATLAPEIIPLLFGEQWDESVAIMQWLVPAAALTAISWFDKGLFVGIGKPRVILWLSLTQALLGIALLVVALPLGIVAVAASRSVRSLLSLPTRAYALKRFLGLGPLAYLKNFVKPLGAALAAGVAVVVLRQAGLTPLNDLLAVLLLGGSFAVVYVAVVLLIARSEVWALLRLVRRASQDSGSA